MVAVAAAATYSIFAVWKDVFPLNTSHIAPLRKYYCTSSSDAHFYFTEYKYFSKIKEKWVQFKVGTAQKSQFCIYWIMANSFLKIDANFQSKHEYAIFIRMWAHCWQKQWIELLSIECNQINSISWTMLDTLALSHMHLVEKTEYKLKMLYQYRFEIKWKCTQQ